MKSAPFIVLCFSLFVAGELTGQEKNYYVSKSGDDSRDGLSIQTAWRSLDKISNFDFNPGDSLMLEGGVEFKGTINLTSDDNGSPGKPVVVTSYGNKKATIAAGDGEGLQANNTSFIRIVSLKFEGSGVSSNKGNGIHFFANDSLKSPSDIEVIDCDVRGFKTFGIGFGANDNISYKGYRNVRIIHCNVSENGQAGISSYGSYLGFQHAHFYISNCKVFENRGIPSRTESHTGNGIVMAMIDDLLIEQCEAYRNGADNRCTAGGPVGIWVWMCKNAVIQYCVSHDNYAGLTKDGGGFDIDGGASNCTLQYNYSYNNEGAGYLLAEYGAVFPYTNNIVRFNISFNDGRKNGYGGISIWGAGKEYRVTNTYIYNNTIYLDDRNIVNGKPAAITLLGPHFSNVIAANNIIATKGNVSVISSDTVVNESAFLLLHNNYYSFSNLYHFQMGKNKFNSIQAWLSETPKQEKLKGKSLWMNFDPRFKDQHLLTALSSKNLEKYFKKGLILLPGSPLRMKPFDLGDHFNILSNTKDYCNNELSSDGKVIPGACTR